MKMKELQELLKKVEIAGEELDKPEQRAWELYLKLKKEFGNEYLAYVSGEFDTYAEHSDYFYPLGNLMTYSYNFLKYKNEEELENDE
jgi:hypothetical protein